MLSPEQLQAAMTLRPHEELCALLAGISERVRLVERAAQDAEAEQALAEDLCVAALFAVEADSHQRADQYVFANTGLSDAHVGAFLEHLFARDPSWRAGILGRLHAHHVALRRARSHPPTGGRPGRSSSQGQRPKARR
jgi:hypothetical protein